jgi:hypothetical protein
MLGVTAMTISRDLEEFSHDVKTQTRTSARGRKNEGRPNGSNGAVYNSLVNLRSLTGFGCFYWKQPPRLGVISSRLTERF